MARHTLMLEIPPDQAGRFTVTGDEAKHAVRVKRVREGDVVHVLDGAGGVLLCRVAAATRELELEVVERTVAERVVPAVDVFTATPKGPRMEKMIDALSQAGANSWTPIATKLGVVDPGANKMERSRRVVMESAKQALRAWPMEVRKKSDFERAIRAGAGEAVVVADASGGRYEPTGAAVVRLVVGPEGGLTEQELAAARKSGAQVARFGPHTMRIETAAVVGVAVVLEREGAPSASSVREGSTNGGS